MAREEGGGEAGAVSENLAPDLVTSGGSSTTRQEGYHQPGRDEVKEAPARADVSIPSDLAGGTGVARRNLRPDRSGAVLRSQREFVRDAGHELRNVLTICRGHLELISNDPEERRATIALVLNELKRMGRIMDDLQGLAEAEQPDFLRREPIDVELFAHELIVQASELDLRNWTLDNVSAGTLFADGQRLTEAVMNLIQNAVQHTLPEDTIALGVSQTEDETRVWVRDTGPGIEPSDQSRIFERFLRGTNAHRHYRGSGLGLAIVKAIATAHRGRVELESRVGDGSKFTIVIPRHSSEETAAD
jgi:two-component system, OmpR family, sensor kinase